MAVGVSEFPLRVEGPKRDNEVRQDHVWWLLPDKDLHRGALAVADAIEKRDSRRRDSNLLHARLYGNRELVSLLRPNGYARTAPGRPAPTGNRITFNVIESCASTAAAFIARSKPKPEFLTDDADASMQSRAKWLTRYVEGCFYEGKAYPVGQRAFVHATVFGTGIVHSYWEDGPGDRSRLAFEWVLPDEILIDEEDGRYGQPRQLHRRKRVLKERLIALFPKRANEIRNARGEHEEMWRTPSRVEAVDPDSHVTVTESWHLRSGAEAKDGRHAISIDGCTLLSERYDADYFPFTFFNWKDPLEGFWGSGLAEELLPIQLEIMRLCRTISESQRLACVPRVFLEATTQVVGAHLNDIPGGVVRYVGRQPVIGPAPGAAPELYSALNDWIRRAYEQTGISQLQAASQKPAGLNSGAALREFSDNASGRFGLTSQRWEEFFMELSRKAVDMSRRRFEAGDKKLFVKAPHRDFIRLLKWSDVDLAEDCFVMKVFPANSLPTTPAARKDTIVELMQAGLIPRDQALALLDYPDLKAYTSLATAAFEDIKDTIDSILEQGKLAEVDELTNLQLAVQMGQSSVLRAKHRGVREERIELLRRWVDACREKLQESTQPPPDQATAANDNGGPPQGGGPIIPGRAKGGPVEAGQPYVVGEEGPEVVVPQKDPSSGMAAKEKGDGTDRKVRETDNGLRIRFGRKVYGPRGDSVPAALSPGDWVDVREIPGRDDAIEVITVSKGGQASSDIWVLKEGAPAASNDNDNDAAPAPGIPGRAEGGPVEAGQPFVVGEHGPEIIVPAQDGTVIPNHQSNALARAAHWLAQQASPARVEARNEEFAKQHPWMSDKVRQLQGLPRRETEQDRQAQALREQVDLLQGVKFKTEVDAMRQQLADAGVKPRKNYAPVYDKEPGQYAGSATSTGAGTGAPTRGAAIPKPALNDVSGFIPSGVLPLADDPDHGQLRQGTDGQAYYEKAPATEQEHRPSLSDPGAATALLHRQPVNLVPPPPTTAGAQAEKPKQKKPRPMTPEELRAAADKLEQQMKAEHEARMAAGPAIKPTDE